jgi:DNA-binding LacI/PurR family transcriptional regulator
MADIRDVARKAGVSPSTVSRVMNNLDRVSPETKERVMTAVRALQYVPNPWARGMRVESSRTVGIILDSFTDPFSARCLAALESQAAQSGYFTLMSPAQTSEDVCRNLRAFMARQVDGVMILTTRQDKNIERDLALAARQTCVVAFNQLWDIPGVSSLYADSFQAAYNGTLHLLESGYRNIAHLTAKAGSYDETEMRRGFLQALREKNLSVPIDHILQGDQTVKGGYLALQKLLQSGKKYPDALLTADDASAVGALWCAQEMGISVPHQMAVLGYGNTGRTQLCRPTLSSVSLPVEKMAADAVTLVAGSEKVGVRKVYDTQIISRHSTHPKISVKLDFTLL